MTIALSSQSLARHAADLPPLQAIDADKLELLHRILSRHRREDSYSVSASYFAMTGRKGLWLYGDHKSFMLIAAHPNRDNHLLLFPPIGRNPNRLLARAFTDPRILASDKIQIARIGPQDGLLSAWIGATGQFSFQREDVLDWAYPVHTLGTPELVAHQGQAFRDFRKNIARANERGLTARPIENEHDRRTVIGLARAWASANPHVGYAQDDLIAPTAVIVNLMDKTGVPLHGLIIEEGDKPQGFILWEETDPENGIANSMCNTALAGKGTTEFAYLSMAKTLLERGFERVCIGGSETPGLDAFKRKMQPVQSIDLQSAAFSASRTADDHAGRVGQASQSRLMSRHA